jgi:hypothetical protein
MDKIVFINKLKIDNSITNKLLILVFIWSSLIFLLNLQLNLSDANHTILFWLSILLMFGSVLYQIFYTENKIFVFFEIFIFILLLHLVHQLGFYGLNGSDPYIDYNLLKTIVNNHHFVLGQDVDGWPMMHIFSSAITFVTKIDPFIIAKFLPSFISSIIILPYYLLVYKINRDKKIALFSCLVFSTIPKFMDFEASFVRETFALFIMIFFIYVIYISKKRNDNRFTLLPFLLIAVVVFAHHLTAFLILLLLGVYITASKIIPFIYRKDETFISKLSGRININIIFLTTLIAVVAYWIYHAVFVLKHSIDFVDEILGLKYVTTTYAASINLNAPIITLQGNIIYYGFFFFHLLFSLILLIKFIKIKNEQKIEDTSFSLFFFFCMFYAFLALYIVGSLPYPDRFLPFAWMFGIIPLTGFLLVFKKNIFKKILVILIVVFMLYNVYNIDPDYYTGNASNTGTVATEKEYIIAQRYDFPDEYYGYNGVVAAIFDIQGIKQRTGGISIGELGDSFDYTSMAVISEQIYSKDLLYLKEKSPEEYDKVIRVISYKNYINIDKICDFGSIYILKGNS